MLRFLLIPICLLCLSAYGQDTITKYIVIDTVIFEKGVSKRFKSQYSFASVDNGFDFSYVDNGLLMKTCLNFTAKARFTKNDLMHRDSTLLGIVVDDKGGLVHICNAEQAPDTLHIDKWIVLHNTLPDSTHIYKQYAKNADSSREVYKTLSYWEVSNHNKITIPPPLDVVVNKQQYKVSLSVYTYGRITHYHGTPTRRDERRKYSDNWQERTYRTFWGANEFRQKQYTGYIDLDNKH